MNLFIYYQMSAIIVAMDERYGIGYKNAVPWHGTAEGRIDLSYFAKETRGHIVLMGYNTWCSIGKKPLKGRINLVISKSHLEELQSVAQDLAGQQDIVSSHERYVVDRSSNPAPLKAFDNLDEAVLYGSRLENLSADNEVLLKCFIIGGEQIYRQYLRSYRPREAFISIIPGEYICDARFPYELLDTASPINLTSEIVKLDSCPYSDGVKFQRYTWINEDETRYLDNFRRVLKQGVGKEDRTGVGTLSLFSPPELEFSLLNDVLPLLTTKRIAFKILAKELLWFISGSSDTCELERQGVNIWRGNTSRQFLDSRGLQGYRIGELGPGYGFQWRHSGATYAGPDADYEGCGVDQLATLVRQLQEDPDSRRMIMSAWNPCDLNAMALPPCHILFQLWTRVGRDGCRYLSGKLYQRSADSFLGVPFNIASYTLLLHILAKLTGMVAERLVCTYGDYHIYSNHLEQVQRQMSRTPRPFPKIVFSERVVPGFSIDKITIDDFNVVGYLPHNGIMATMAI